MKVTAFVIVGFALGGCTSPSPSNDIGRNRGALVQSDGKTAFYTGKGIGDLLAKGLPIDDATHPEAFMRLRVPTSFVDEALATPHHIKSVSFEVADPSIEATVHWFARERKTGQIENIYFHPGDPWVTGVAQVAVSPDGFTMGLFDVIRWNRDRTGTMPSVLAQEIHTTGLMPDDDMPVLRYAQDPTKVPLPDNWK
jgi:hypothetical protein